MNHKKELVTEKYKDKVRKEFTDRASPDQKKVKLQDILRYENYIR